MLDLWFRQVLGGTYLHVHISVLYLRNGPTDCVRIWCMVRDSLAMCFPQVWLGCLCTCSSAPLLCLHHKTDEQHPQSRTKSNWAIFPSRSLVPRQTWHLIWVLSSWRTQIIASNRTINHPNKSVPSISIACHITFTFWTTGGPAFKLTALVSISDSKK